MAEKDKDQQRAEDDGFDPKDEPKDNDRPRDFPKEEEHEVEVEEFDPNDDEQVIEFAEIAAEFFRAASERSWGHELDSVKTKLAHAETACANVAVVYDQFLSIQRAPEDDAGEDKSSEKDKSKPKSTLAA